METVRASLINAVTRGRLIPVPQVRPSPSAKQLPELAGFVVEEVQYLSDDSAQGWVPLRLVKRAAAEGPPAGPAGAATAAAAAAPQQQPQRLPVAILLHATGVNKDDLAPRQAEFAGRGYLVASIDCRYHGDRRDPAFTSDREGYEAALVRAWREGPERPFLLDNVWDLLRLLDYLETRPDADMARVGMTGVSLGGMHTWLAAAADGRVAAAAPMIGVQTFRWAVGHNRFQGRVGSIPEVFEGARRDLGRAKVDAEVVRAVWDKLLPGLLEDYDAPQSLPLIAPRPLLVLNGEFDPRCPLEGVDLAMEAAGAEYTRQGAPGALRLFVERGVGHECTPAMWRETAAWLDKHLQPGGAQR